MNTPSRLLLLVALVGCSAAPPPAVRAPGGPVRIVFDTDMDTDADDAGALAMLHALADRGEVEILATPVSSAFAWSAPATDVINHFHGRPDLPIGTPRGPRVAVDQRSRYAETLAREYPHDLRSAAAAPSAVEVYRSVLAAQPDGSVVIVTVGNLTNLGDLLESGPDAHSPLDGRALVARKVRELVAMGSRYPADLDPAVWGNFKPEPASVVRVARDWPGPITFTGGGAFAELLATGARLAEEAPPGSPVRRAYELYFDGAIRNRHSADQIAVLIAARGTGHPWQLVTEGYNHIFPDGRHEWRTDRDDPRHRYISALAPGADPAAVAREIEDLMVRAPARR